MFLPIGLRICCKELAKHSPSVGFTFGEIFVIHYKVASRRPKLEIHAASCKGKYLEQKLAMKRKKNIRTIPTHRWSLVQSFCKAG
ncbi:uncharacterized protein LOC133862904 isoform X2 [Alnus glutinosa]|uniref:uncharacterized protein LOC133862904 isoform X2 n=1 Tax=Alnus glutinosa TaxID=3517 RepID=UPI002D7A33E4|nr:uncharacterized protein LOC133862904 isoform X2 [Alnus glutinosa]